MLFGALFWTPTRTLVQDWWSHPDSGHGLLLAPVAGLLVWRTGLAASRRAQPILGLLVLTSAVVLRYVSSLAVEVFTMRMSLMVAGAGLVIFYAGLPQLRRWWLPAVLLVLSIPIPAVVLNSVSLPLQLKASGIGAALLEWRQIPVELTGNMIHLPGRSLFVAEACSGLRSLTALLALGVLIGGLWLRSPWSRGVLVLLAVPAAVLLNGVRVFLTGFFVYFVDPEFGNGFIHYTEGWVMFTVALGVLSAIAVLLASVENAVYRVVPA